MCVMNGGNNDLGIALSDANSIATMFGTGSGTFTGPFGCCSQPTQSMPAVDSLPEAVAAGDFDGDSDQDLAVGNFNAVPQPPATNNTRI